MAAAEHGGSQHWRAEHVAAKHGPIRVSGATSRVAANSSDGSVRLSFAAPPDRVDHSSDGSVTIDRPQSNDAYRLNAISSDGR